MNLFYLTPLIYPSNYANRAQVIKMSEAFEKNGFNTHLFVSQLNSKESEIFEKYKVKDRFKLSSVGTSKFKPRSFFYALSLKKVISSAPSNTVFYIRDIILCFWLILLSKRFREHFFFENHSLHRFPKFLYMFCFKYSKGIITTNKYKKNLLIKYGFNQEKIIVEPNAVDSQRFSNFLSQKEAREQIGIEEDKRIVLYIGSFSPDRGISTFLKVASMSKSKDTVFYAVGGKRDQVEKLRTQFKSPNLYIKEFIPYEEVTLYYAASDILVAPWSGKFEISRIQASPLKMPEFMFSGRPVIVSDLPMTREWGDDSMVYFTKPDNPEDIVKKVEYINNNKNEASEKARLAKQKMNFYTWEKRSARILDFIRQKIEK